MRPFSEITACRVCGSREILPVLSLGTQALTGVFPRTREQTLTEGPLDLVKCGSGPDTCGLVQLKQTYEKNELYGENYGYRSSLNSSMVEHLRNKVRAIEAAVPLGEGDLVVDIGSNDGTLLRSYKPGPTLVGIDPTGKKFSHFYPDHIELIPEFFSADALRDRFGDSRAKVITSIAMFYDLDSPMEFVQQIRDLLDDDGIWVLEQSYLPSMVAVTAYDTICHEHLEYYGLRQIQWMTDRMGLRIVDVELNDINGGSFSVVVVKEESPIVSRDHKVRILYESEAPYAGIDIYGAFRKAVEAHRDALLNFFSERQKRGETVLGCGASTKGNVILQYCNLSGKHLPAIGEINPDKFGCFTPGTMIPIIPEEEVLAQRPDYLLVFPWHFRDFFLRKEADYLDSGGRLFFPLPSPVAY